MFQSTQIALAVGVAALTLIGWVAGALSPHGLAQVTRWLDRKGNSLGPLSGAGVALLSMLAFVWLLLFAFAIMATFGFVIALQHNPSSGSIGMGAVLIGVLGTPFLVWNTVIKQHTLKHSITRLHRCAIALSHSRPIGPPHS